MWRTTLKACGLSSERSSRTEVPIGARAPAICAVGWRTIAALGWSPWRLASCSRALLVEQHSPALNEVPFVSSSASKERPVWPGLSGAHRRAIEEVAGCAVAKAESRSGGFSPGFASLLRLRDQREVFVKAIDLRAWPDQGET